MSNKPKVLIQLDSDQHPSVFDSIVAVDSGVDHLLTFGLVEPIDVRELVHGAMFTRGGNSLKNTAIFIGGSNVGCAEQILKSVRDSFFGPVRVSVMLDANGANTTAAAAVLCLQRHLDIKGQKVAVLGATGPVGIRVSQLLAGQNAIVRIASRSYERADQLCSKIMSKHPDGRAEPYQTGTPDEFDHMLDDCDAIISAGAASVRLVKKSQLEKYSSLRVAIDLNAVPPTGLEGIESMDNAQMRGELIGYGAIGVGDLKMKIHRLSLQTLFESNDKVLDVDEIYRLGKSIEQEKSA